jgi:WD40 repeat protein
MRIQRMAQALLVILTIASIAIARQTWERQQGPRPVAEDDSGPIMYAAFAPATDRVALTTKSTYEDVALFDTTRWNRIGSVARTKGYLRTLAFSPDGSTLAGSDDQFLFIWDVASGAVRARIATPQGTGGARAIALSPQGRWVAVAYWSAQYGALNAQGVHRFDLSTTPPMVLPPLAPLPSSSPITCLEFSPDAKWLFSGENQGRVCAWDLTINWQPARAFETHSPIVAIAPAPDGHSVFVAANVLYHYNFATNHLIGTVPFDRSAPCTALAVSPDGQRVLTVDGAIRVRNIADGAIIAIFRRQSQAYRAAFSADGKRVFTADQDGHLRAWELPGEAAP